MSRRRGDRGLVICIVPTRVSSPPRSLRCFSLSTILCSFDVGKTQCCFCILLTGSSFIFMQVVYPQPHIVDPPTFCKTEISYFCIFYCGEFDCKLFLYHFEDIWPLFFFLIKVHGLVRFGSISNGAFMLYNHHFSYHQQSWTKVLAPLNFFHK